MEVGKARLVEKLRAQNRGVISLNRPRPPRVPARDARGVRPPDGILRVVVEETIDVDAKHQVLVRRELVVQPSIEKELPVASRVVEVTVRRQQEGGQGGRQERRSILPRVVRREEKEGLVLDDRTADGAR